MTEIRRVKRNVVVEEVVDGVTYTAWGTMRRPTRDEIVKSYGEEYVEYLSDDAYDSICETWAEETAVAEAVTKLEAKIGGAQ